jgi:hypothetical protein
VEHGPAGGQQDGSGDQDEPEVHGDEGKFGDLRERRRGRESRLARTINFDVKVTSTDKGSS